MPGAALTPEYFRRLDDSDDWLFYQTPRLVTHIDTPAIAALEAYFELILPDGGDVLDLMSSCVSHYPRSHVFGSVTGLGMNRVELDANPRLTERVVHDLNHDPTLPFDDGCFDACTISVSVQYLIQPIKVFAELGRVLRPGAPCVVSYSNRCFPTKAIALWRALDDGGHGNLIRRYFETAGTFGPSNATDLSPAPDISDPLFVVTARRESE
ncbi:MAG: methyltransferase domain-containing protein [Rhodospirillales bacterium]|nr:methyltransferase domain-containing protein [Rhodospirillales bacterium]